MVSKSHEFAVKPSKVDVRKPEFRDNLEKWKPIISNHEAALEQAASQGNEKSRGRHIGRGQLLGRSSFGF